MGSCARELLEILKGFSAHIVRLCGTNDMSEGPLKDFQEFATWQG